MFRAAGQICSFSGVIPTSGRNLGGFLPLVEMTFHQADCPAWCGPKSGDVGTLAQELPLALNQVQGIAGYRSFGQKQGFGAAAVWTLRGLGRNRSVLAAPNHGTVSRLTCRNAWGTVSLADWNHGRVLRCGSSSPFFFGIITVEIASDGRGNEVL